jgi:hypothetical protein
MEDVTTGGPSDRSGRNGVCDIQKLIDINFAIRPTNGALFVVVDEVGVLQSLDVSCE